MVPLYMVGMYPTRGTSQSWMAVGRPPTLTIIIWAKLNKKCGVFLPFRPPKMMLHGVVCSTTFQELFVLAKLKISSNLVEQFKF